MGNEILYCSHCRSQLRSADFEKRKAFKLEGQVLCKDCCTMLHGNPPGESIEVPEEPTSPPKGRSSGGSRSTTRRIPTVAPSPVVQNRSAAAENSSHGWVIGACVGLALIALLGVASLGGNSSHPVRSTLSPPEPTGRSPQPDRPQSASAPPSPQIPREELLRKDGPELAPALKREAAALISLRKAIEFDEKSSSEFEASSALYEQALWDARETSVYPEAKRRMDALRARQRQRLLAELAPIAEQIRGMMDKERFGAALEALEKARTLRDAPSWKSLLDEHMDEVRKRTEKVYLPMKEKALEAQKRGESDAVSSVTGRISTWGMPAIMRDLEDALAKSGKTAPLPPGEPSANQARETFLSVWKSAMASCPGREFQEAVKTLEGAAIKIEDQELRSEAAADLVLLRKAAGLYAEATELLTKWPKGKELAILYLDPAGIRRELKAPVSRADAFRISFSVDKDTILVEAGEILSSSLVNLLSRRSGRALASDGPGLALLCLADGDPGAARKLLTASGTSLPEKYWSWGDDLRSRSESPEDLNLENVARSLFYAAERELGTPATEASGVLKYRALLADGAGSRFVRRNRASISSRVEGGKEYAFIAEDLSGAGSFKLSRTKIGGSWVSDSDSENSQRKNNYVDIDFSVLPESRYRCWVYVGGCCAEVLAFGIQGTEMKGSDSAIVSGGSSAEAGSDTAAPVKHTVAGATKTHSSHGGRKQPTHWGWAEIPLPPYTSEGPKKVRLVTDQQGFAVAFACVSAVRKTPPSDAELKDLEKVRAARFAIGDGGLISGSLEKAAGGYDLSKVGTLDWVYWGRGGAYVNLDHKSGGGGQISSATLMGAGVTSGAFATDLRSVSWTDGSPTRTGTNEHGYIWTNGSLNSGFTFTCPAGTARRTLLVYCGASTATATLTASLSDNSAPPYVSSYDGPGAFLYTISFKANSAKQTLKISLLKTGNHPGFTDGSADLIAAMLR
ncbi:MAG TPA: hypothetical protein VMU54_12600 [Planctomycetota bacterium]|nr:hypothetical protein [Planctomycetota bacterium]